MNTRQVLMPAIAIAAAVNVLMHDWLYSSLYFFTAPPWQVGLMAVAPAICTAAALLTLDRILPKWPWERVVDGLTLLVLAFFAYNTCKQQGLLEGQLNWPAKLALALGTVFLAGSMPWRLPGAVLVRLRLAIIVFGVLFLAGPAIFARLQSGNNLKLGRYWEDTQTVDAPPTVVLVLDELSAQGAAPIVQRLVGLGQAVTATSIRSSGSHTISAIPALLTGVAFEEARACSPWALCATSGLFDFSRQVVTRPGVNIVGFFHPYCAMTGLAYCRQHAVNGFPNILVGYGCNLLAIVAGGRRFETCERALRPFAVATQVRQAIREDAMAAPFWRDGGTLYVHTMLPHPPGADGGHSLATDYAANIELAADLAADLARKLEARFGARFRFVITSDHPLRPQIWCGPLRYSEPDCQTNARYLSKEVPLITVGAFGPDLKGLASNLELLDRLASSP